jgi:uncharacterized damage-inducible protein DinB
MQGLLFDLLAHQFWADAEHWRSLESHPGALDDDAIRKRLYHIHIVQRAFLHIVKRERMQLKKPEEFLDMMALKQWAIDYQTNASEYFQTLTDEKLSETVLIPWFKEPPLTISVGHALTQAAMHRHYHRAQNATRLRELGGDPPLTDFIAWLWKNKPIAKWVHLH